MTTESGGGVVVSLLRFLVGDVPQRWLRLVLFGAGMTFVVFTLRDFVREIRAESAQVRSALTEYIASNKAWQEASLAERQRLVHQANKRFKRLYDINQLEYEPMGE